MSLQNVCKYAVVCIGNNDGILLPIDDAAEAVKLLGRGVSVEYSWGASAYKYKKPGSRSDTLKMEAVSVTQLATMALETD